MQLSPTSAISANVIHALETSGARTFSLLVDRFDRLKDVLDKGLVTLILAPSDVAIEEFSVRYNKATAILGTSTIGQAIMANHVSAEPLTTNPSIKAINGYQIALDAATVTNVYRIAKSFTVGSISIHLIQTVLVDAAQIPRLMAERSSGLKTAMGVEGLNALLTSGRIKGKELIRLCNSNFETNDFCNRKDRANGQTIFHRLLQQEFGLTIPSDQDARKQYVVLHNSKVGYTYYRSRRGATKINGAGFAKVSDELHIQSFEIEKFTVCLTINHVVKVYRWNAETHGFDEVHPIQIQNGNFGPLPAIKKIGRSELGTVSNKVFVLTYDGLVYSTQTIRERDDNLVFEPNTLIDRYGPFVDIYGKYRISKDSRGTQQIVVASPNQIVMFGNDGEPISVGAGGSCVIRRNNACLIALNAGGFMDLSNFPGGQFTCHNDNVLLYNQGTTVFILNDIGQLWLGLQPLLAVNWHRIGLPDDARIIDASTSRVFNSEFNYQIAILDYLGRIYIVTLTDQIGSYQLRLHATVQGLVEIPAFNSNTIPEMVGLSQPMRLDH
jgi:hypothetical protein